MSLPSNFALLALSPTIRDNAAFLFLQSGSNGLIDIMIQGTTGSPVNIMQINTGVTIDNTVYVSVNGNDNTGRREELNLPFQTIEAALNAAVANDTIHVLPGSYSVTGNMYKANTNLFFNKSTVVTLNDNGKVHITGGGAYNIYGFLSLINNSSEVTPLKITAGTNKIEYDTILLYDGAVSITGTNAAYFSANNTYSEFYSDNIHINNNVTEFSRGVITSDYCRVGVGPATTNSLFSDVTFSSTTDLTDPLAWGFSGLFQLRNCVFTNTVEFCTKSGFSSEIRGTKLQGGVITSGSTYFENCTFDTQNYNYYPNFSIITNRGGHSVFANCYARNFNNTNYVAYTFRPTGSASGVNNFNISNVFTSFKGVDTGVSINYGTFIYNLGLK